MGCIILEHKLISRTAPGLYISSGHNPTPGHFISICFPYNQHRDLHISGFYDRLWRRNDETLGCRCLGCQFFVYFLLYFSEGFATASALRALNLLGSYNWLR
ncbi:hypothetical protein GDO81_022859 [Engystomops pustulosus]|uniref:Uncharacterized protein n=1 Tax=Engystomops pustulosus TaxID=76066 RepID=A0AAV6YSX9_ENGPU|nr:hypothetical protein GDO81_022859 [Engystomops pustulosus]